MPYRISGPGASPTAATTAAAAPPPAPPAPPPSPTPPPPPPPPPPPAAPTPGVYSTNSPEGSPRGSCKLVNIVNDPNAFNNSVPNSAVSSRRARRGGEGGARTHKGGDSTAVEGLPPPAP